jgi:hypothetical protein
LEHVGVGAVEVPGAGGDRAVAAELAGERLGDLDDEVVHEIPSVNPLTPLGYCETIPLTTDKENAKMPSKDVAQKVKYLLDLCEKSPAIARVEKGTKHWKVYAVDKTKRVHRIPTTPSDHRWFENQLSDLRKLGVEIPKKGGRK